MENNVKLFRQLVVLNFVDPLAAIFLLGALLFYFHATGVDYTYAFMLALGSFFVYNSIIASIKASRQLQSYALKRPFKFYFLNQIIGVSAKSLALSVLVTAIYFTTLNFAFISKLEYFPHTLIGLLIFVGILYFAASLYIKKVWFAFTSFSERKDLDKRYSKLMDKLNIKAKFSHVANGFFGIINVFAIIPSNEIVLVGPIEDILTGKELDTVVVHELMHIKHKKGFLLKNFSLIFILLIAFRIFSELIFSGQRYLYSNILFFFYPVIIGVGFIFLTSLVGMSTKRGFERRTDKNAEALIDKEIYHKALIKIHSANKIPSGIGLSKILPHIEIEERIK